MLGEEKLHSVYHTEEGRSNGKTPPQATMKFRLLFRPGRGIPFPALRPEFARYAFRLVSQMGPLVCCSLYVPLNRILFSTPGIQSVCALGSMVWTIASALT